MSAMGDDLVRVTLSWSGIEDRKFAISASRTIGNVGWSNTYLRGSKEYEVLSTLMFDGGAVTVGGGGGVVVFTPG